MTEPQQSTKVGCLSLTSQQKIHKRPGHLSSQSLLSYTASDQVAQALNPYNSSYSIYIYSNRPRSLVIDKPIIVHKRPGRLNTRLAIKQLSYTASQVTRYLNIAILQVTRRLSTKAVRLYCKRPGHPSIQSLLSYIASNQALVCQSS